MSKKVVVFTYSGDSPDMLREIDRALRARGAECLRFDTDRFPLETQAAFVQDGVTESICFADGTARVTLGADDAVWYRRVRYGAKLPRSMDAQLRSACIGESEALLRGLLSAAPCFVLDSPERVKRCGHKPRQQRLAREVGLFTPRTLMTNDATAAAEFLRSCKHGAIAKMLSAFAIYSDKNEEQVVFTTALSDAHLSKLSDLRFCPMVFQERIVKQLELRITVIGNRMYAAAVDSMAVPGAEVDWREKGLTLIRSWMPYTLPRDVAAALDCYMNRIGMQYSAIDMIVEPSGRHVFLEANPVGEFFWLEHNAPHFPLTEALADVLCDLPGARRQSLEERP